NFQLSVCNSFIEIFSEESFIKMDYSKGWPGVAHSFDAS
ncbi:hypothetical protein HHX47_DHR4001065, partial [Lentinula edodes]